jgi:hypothetical protein
MTQLALGGGIMGPASEAAIERIQSIVDRGPWSEPIDLSLVGLSQAFSDLRAVYNEPPWPILAKLHRSAGPVSDWGEEWSDRAETVMYLAEFFERHTGCSDVVTVECEAG